MSTLDLLIVGAGPTGIAIGAAARAAGLDALCVDRGGLAASIAAYPTDLLFFTTRERLEIAGVPFAIPEDKPNRRQALAYYREVVRACRVPLALYEEVRGVRPEGPGFVVETVKDGFPQRREARAVAIATGYFLWPRRLGVPGEDQPWVRSRYREPYPHVAQDVVVVGGGNTAVETALDLFRNGARVTLVHHRPTVKPSIKYWLKPDFDHRVEEGSIAARFETRVVAFHPATASTRTALELEGPGHRGAAAGRELLPADAAYVLIGYRPDMSLLAGAGVEIEPETLIPAFDPETCESNVPGLYVGGTLQAGRATDRIFIENSRDHGPKIARHLAARLRA